MLCYVITERSLKPRLKTFLSCLAFNFTHSHSAVTSKATILQQYRNIKKRAMVIMTPIPITRTTNNNYC